MKANPDLKLNYPSCPKRNEEMPPTAECSSLICEGVGLLSVPTGAPRMRIKEKRLPLLPLDLKTKMEIQKMKVSASMRVFQDV